METDNIPILEEHRMNRRTFLMLVGLPAVMAVGSGELSQASGLKAKPPNIVFIFADDWGYGDLSCHGSNTVKTPYLDRLAQEGIDFQNFTVCNPVCSPSRTAVMTGQFPARHCIHQHFAGVEHHQKTGMPDWLDPDVPMLPRMLQQAGYVTGHFGKWHLTNRHIDDAPLPPAYGYDEYGAFNLPGKQIGVADTCPLAADFIRRHRDKPFFVNVWIHETHTPHYPKDAFLKQFEHLDEQQRVYAAVVAEGDAGVGLILDTLKELNLDKNTLVIFSSDNGPEWTGSDSGKKLNDISTGAGLGTYYSVGTTAGLKGRKRSLFAGGVRTPFIARWPGLIPAGKTDRSSVISAVDLFPTFLELVGQDMPRNYRSDGESILSALYGKPFKRNRPIYWEWKGYHGKPHLWPCIGVRDGKWKLMLNQEMNRTELYDIEADWAETRDLSAEYPEVVRSLTAQVLQWKTTLPDKPPSHCFSKLRK